jgi:2Fe-2S ferredoxin
MARITFISHEGMAQTIDAESGLSLMESAIREGVEGIDADCGGACACGTCRVVVDETWRERIGEAGDVEAMMLEMAPLPLEGARLSCQISVSDALDGLIVSVPEAQFR